MKYIFGVVLSMLSMNVFCGVTTGTTSVKEIYSYATAGIAGDIIFTVNEPISECTGFWGDSSTVGFKNNLSVILSAYHAGSPVLVYADETQKFSGSSANYCKLTIIRLRPK